MLDLNHKSILITGGTGSFGKKFTERILTQFPKVKRLVILSRDELKQFEMSQTFSPEKYPAIRYFLGDVRDKERLVRAFEGIDIVIHAAALKQVPMAEYNPTEFIKTNVGGAENVIHAAIERKVKTVVALSTDKAAAPINLYGATKLCSDKLFVAANNFTGEKDIRFSVVRYGNVMGSRGSVIPFFMDRRTSKSLPITDENMTRFNISLDEGVDLVFKAIENSLGGEIYVPKLPSYKITDVATAIGPNCTQEIVGIRPGEKIHEEMITTSDAYYTLEFDDYFIIHPTNPKWNIEERMKNENGKKVPTNFCYNSGENTEWVSIEEMRALIKTHVDPNFEV